MLTVFSDSERLHAPDVAVTEWLSAGNTEKGVPLDNPLPVNGTKNPHFEHKVILLDFWDYSCINCLNSLPVIRRWHEQYAPYGLEIIGIHAPEFFFAHDALAVGDAVSRLGIPYVVGLDNRFQTWDAYANRAWPAQYLIDGQGYLKAYNRGEGKYHSLESLIRQELAVHKPEVLSLPFVSTSDDDDVLSVCARLTPELYLGRKRGRFGNVDERYLSPESDRIAAVLPPVNTFRIDTPYLQGEWRWDREYLESVAEGSVTEIQLICQAGRMFAVMEAPELIKVWYAVDGAVTGWRWVQKAQCYLLHTFSGIESHRISLWCDAPGLRVYSLLFQP